MTVPEVLLIPGHTHTNAASLAPGCLSAPPLSVTSVVVPCRSGASGAADGGPGVGEDGY